MHTRDIYDSGFDEETGRTLTKTACPECDGRLETDGGETSCRECGVIVDSYYIDHSFEPRAFPDEDTQKERTGAPLTEARHDRGLSTEIGWRKDAKGNTLSERKRCQLNRLRREHTRGRWRSKAERNLAHGLGSITRLTGVLDLPRSLKERACSLVRIAQEEYLVQGLSIEGIAAGCVYGVCRINGVTRTVAEVSEYARVEQSHVLTCYRVLNEVLSLPAPPRSPQEFVRKLAGEFALSAGVVYRAETLASRAHESGVSAGKHPAGFAATCLRVVAEEVGETVVQRTVAEAAGVSSATVRSHREAVEALLEEAE